MGYEALCFRGLVAMTGGLTNDQLLSLIDERETAITLLMGSGRM